MEKAKIKRLRQLRSAVFDLEDMIDSALAKMREIQSMQRTIHNLVSIEIEMLRKDN